jgi:AcrR family transcriptional regulator
MDEKPTSVELKIILASIDCIEKYGISGATNRQIARMAGVNIAAINYYFRSKDVLIKRCMEITLKNGFDLSDFPPMPGIPAQERCIAILMDLIEGGFRYPGISRAHFHNLLAEGQYDPLLAEHLNRFIDELANDLHKRDCVLEINELKLALIQMISAVLLAILAPDLFEGNQGINLHDPDTCRAYVTRLVSRLIA